MGLSTGGETVVIDALLTGRFISLHTADPGNTGASEVVGGAYARQSAAFTKSGNNPMSARNTAVIQFPAATAAWGTITHYGLWSAATGGTFLGSYAVASAKIVQTDDIVRWEVSALTITVD